MMLMLESNRSTRRKLCDLLSRERILCVDSSTGIFEMICKYKKEIDLIIINIRLLTEVTSHQVYRKLCQKLAIEAPPVLVFYMKSDDKIREDFERENPQLRFI